MKQLTTIPLIIVLITSCTMNGVFETSPRAMSELNKDQSPEISILWTAYMAADYAEVLEYSQPPFSLGERELRGKAYLMLGQPEMAYAEYDSLMVDLMMVTSSPGVNADKNRVMALKQVLAPFANQNAEKNLSEVSR